jgi:tRNA pseudouridine38-40 synthase
MSLWKLTLAYDGTPYHGWQVQPGLSTVQGTLADAIHRITRERILPQGSGRTDTGVHALAQVATFPLNVPIPAENLHRALNRALPPSIRVLSVEPAPEHFHARHSALRKTYEYRIFPQGRICSPMLANFVWACPIPLHLSLLQQAATHILGTHDFTSFAAVDPDLQTRTEPAPLTVPVTDAGAPSFAASSHRVGYRPKDDRSPNPTPNAQTSVEPPPSNTRTIYHSTWRQTEDLLIYRVTGSGFLHHMVRNLVGTFVEVGSGRIAPDSILEVLAAHNRSAAGPTAPARGLFLVEVEY